MSPPALGSVTLRSLHGVTTTMTDRTSIDISFTNLMVFIIAALMIASTISKTGDKVVAAITKANTPCMAPDDTEDEP